MRVRNVIAAALTAVCAVVTPALAQHPERAASAQTINATSAEARRADIAFFRENFMARDVSYAAPARTEAESRLTALDARAGEVSQAYFELELARIVALADNGHTASFPGRDHAATIASAKSASLRSARISTCCARMPRMPICSAPGWLRSTIARLRKCVTSPAL